jgi:hypothetical protein
MSIQSTNDPAWSRIHLATPNSNYLIISGLSQHKFGIRDWLRGTTDFVIDTFGHIGIGTMNPDYQIQEESEGLKIYPNPATSSIQLKSSNQTEVMIYNIQGVLQLQIQLDGEGDEAIDLSGWTKGVYLFLDSNTQSVTKVIVQ